MRLFRVVIAVCFCLLLASFAVPAQKRSGRSAKTPKKPVVVSAIDTEALKTMLTEQRERPLLVNFWATWCDPCREEFPDLVKINADYRSKIDFITISLDDLAELKRAVPKFLSSMKADMPAYLRKVPDEGATISSVAKDWTGGLPFTILFDTDGKTIYFRQGKVVVSTLTGHLDSLAPSKTAGQNP